MLDAAITFPLSPYRKFVEKANAGKTMRIAYLGGSITVGGATYPENGTNREGKPYAYKMDVNKDSWRALTFKWFKKRFEKSPAQFEQINAGIGATGSILGAFRLAKDILAYKPDFLFIEFAVNDGGMGLAMDKDPMCDTSIYRTYRSIISRVRRVNPNIAIFIPISTSRPKDIANAFSEPRVYDSAARYTEMAANYFRVPFVRIKDVYYKDPLRTGLERDRLFDGPESPGNTVHPSMQGHRAYADGVIRELEKIFGSFEYQFEETNIGDEKPFPMYAKLYLADEIQYVGRGQWNLASMTNRWSREPSLIGEHSLVSSDPKSYIEFTFQGRSIGAWFDLETNANVDIYIDGVKLGVYQADAKQGKVEGPLFRGRCPMFACGLDVTKDHALKMVPSAGQSVVFIALHGFMVEKTEDEGWDNVPEKQVDRKTYTQSASAVINDGFKAPEKTNAKDH